MAAVPSNYATYQPKSQTPKNFTLYHSKDNFFTELSIKIIKTVKTVIYYSDFIWIVK